MTELLPGFEVFKSGTHQDRHGRTIDIDIAALKKLVRCYRPKLSEAPIVVGHPEDNHPAFGWIKKFKLHGNRLLAYPAKIDQALKHAVRDGHYRKISMSFYHPDSTDNPKPGIWYPRHVGFLGAQAPAVKGLKNVRFAENNDDTVEFAMPLEHDAPQESHEPSAKTADEQAAKKPVRYLLKNLAAGRIQDSITLPEDFLRDLQTQGLIVPAALENLRAAASQFLLDFIRADNDAQQIDALAQLIAQSIKAVGEKREPLPEFSETVTAGIPVVEIYPAATGSDNHARLLGHQLGVKAREYLAHQRAKGHASTMVEAIQHAKTIMRRYS